MSLPKRTCPHCGAHEMFDATTTTEHPVLYEQYPAFRGNARKRVWCCFACKGIETVVVNLQEERGHCPGCGSGAKERRRGSTFGCKNGWHDG